MRIAVVCPYDLQAPGGVQQVCRELAGRLRRAGDDPILVGPGKAPDAVSVGREMRITANRSTVPLSLDPRAIARTRRALAAVDVVHAHEPFVPLVGWAALSAHRPLVATFHADPAPWTRNAYRLGSPLAARILRGRVSTAVSPVAAQALPESWHPVEIIPNALDTEAYAVDVARHPNRIVFLGRDDPRKGLDVLLTAWPEIRAAVPAAELIVMGVDRPVSIPGVQFWGRVDEKRKHHALASASVHVAPNLGGESFGIVVAEGMAAGCAVVASDIPAFEAVLRGAGVLVPAGRTDDLARAVVDLLRAPQHARSLGERAQRAAARFDWARVLSRYQAAYESAQSRYRITIQKRKE